MFESSDGYHKFHDAQGTHCFGVQPGTDQVAREEDV